MSEVYGAQFANQYGDVGGEAFTTWSIGLSALTPDDIEYGFLKLLERKDKFVPNLNEFRSLCEKSLADFGLPSASDAWRKVSCLYSTKDMEWTVPAMYEAVDRCGFWGIKHGQISEKQFTVIYKKVCEEVMQGAVFNAPVYEKKERLTFAAKKYARDKTEKNKALNVSHVSALRASL